MNDDQLNALTKLLDDKFAQSETNTRDDLKQVIDSRMSQSETNIRDDLKQFIDSKISQSEARMNSTLESGLNGVKDEMQEIRSEMRDGFNGVADAFDALDTSDKQANSRIDAIEETVTENSLAIKILKQKNA